MTRLAWLNLGVKLALVALIAFYLLNPDLERFAGKVMPLRSVAFPVAALLLPALWWFRGRPQPYPHIPDILVGSAALIDYGGNVLDLYRFRWFDHLVPLVNVTILVMAFGLLLANTDVPRWVRAALALSFGSVVHTLWEITEFTIAWFYPTQLRVDETTTIIDFSLGLVGASLGAALVYWLLSERVDLGGRVLGKRQQRKVTFGPLPGAVPDG